MDTNRLIDTFCELAALDSPSFGERAVADYLTVKLTELGFAVREYPVDGGNTGNIYGYLDGTGEPVLLCAHMDTVEPSRGKRAVVHADGKITSGGDTVLGADDFAGIAAILEAVRTASRQRPVEVLFCPAEEVYGKGSAQFDVSVLKSTVCYVLDLTGAIGTAAYKAPSILSWTAEVRGKAAHAGFAPQDGIHAIQNAAKALAELPLGKVDADTTCNAGLISGGTATNVIPDKCVVKGEIRSFVYEKALEHALFIKSVFEKYCKVEFSYEVNIMAYETPLNLRVAADFKAACERAGITPRFVATYGGSDNNHFAHKGLSGLVIACGMNNVHSLEEFTTVSELEQITKLVSELIK